MGDNLGQLFSELKTLPDTALQKELASPTGMIPDYMILGELHDRKNMRVGSAGKDKPKSLVSDYIGDIKQYMPQQGQAPQGQAGPPSFMPPHQTPPMGSSSLPMGGQMPPSAGPPGPPAGISSLPPQSVQGYAGGGITTLPGFDDRVDPRLMAILRRAAEGSPYEVKLTPHGGFREGDKRQHGSGHALDIQLYDSGRALPNSKSGETFPQYQQFANQARKSQMELYPELNDKFRWGGYFSGDKNTYGALDEMHFDIGGGSTAGGSWQAGITPEQARLYDIDMKKNTPFGGLNVAALASGDPYEAALLKTIASGESPDYNVLYRGSKFSDYSQHPNTRIPIPNSNAYSSAAGKYQITYPTYQEFGGGKFGPAEQDKMAMAIANKTYGKGLREALMSGDPQQIAQVGQRLNGRWVSLNDQFASKYAANLATAQASGNAAHDVATSTAGQMTAAETADKAEKGGGGDGMRDYYLMSMIQNNIADMNQAPAPQAIPNPATPQRQSKPFNPLDFMQDPTFMMRRANG